MLGTVRLPDGLPVGFPSLPIREICVRSLRTLLIGGLVASLTLMSTTVAADDAGVSPTTDLDGVADVGEVADPDARDDELDLDWEPVDPFATPGSAAGTDQGFRLSDDHDGDAPDADAPDADRGFGDGPLDAACAEAPRGRFPDVAAGDVHAAAIDCLVWWQVAGGFGDGRFVGSQDVTRGQMARFVATSILATGTRLPAPAGTFPDAATTVHRRPIERLAAAGVVGGFDDGRFRAGAPVTRGQMATFLVGVLDQLDVPPGGGDTGGFTDVAGTTHVAAIERAAALGLATGFDDGTFRPGALVTRAQMASFLARTLDAAVRAGTPVRAAAAAVDVEAMGAEVCRFAGGDLERADGVIDRRLRLSPHPEASIPVPPRWNEDPIGDRNWRFQFHTLRWTWSMFGAALQTGDDRYTDLGFELIRSWVDANPFDDPADDEFSWDDHSAAWRALVLSCASLQAEPEEWLLDSMAEHARRLADPDFYVDRGNHALNQDTGLMAIACLTGEWDLRDLAEERTDRLAVESIDRQGVTNEQAVEYQDYNWERYGAALRLRDACGMPNPAWGDRHELMPLVLAHMTQPNQVYTTLGDTDRLPIKRTIDDPALIWLRSDGAEGTAPSSTFVTYDAGFTFARSGWGEPGALDQESFLSLRHGPARQLHGHLDHGSITLYADGEPLLVDAGKYAYTSRPGRAYVVSAESHNVVTVGDGCGPQAGRESPVLQRASDERIDRIAVRVGVCDGAGWTRVLAFVRDTGEVIVIDETRGPVGADVRQRWQLEIGSIAERLSPQRIYASFADGGSMLIDQLTPVGRTTVVSGGTNPLRGLVSPGYNELVPAPNVEVHAADGGTTRRYVTVLRPGAAPDAPSASFTSTSASTTVTLPSTDGSTHEIRLPRVAP